MKTEYDLELPVADIDAYYDLKDRLEQQYAPESRERIAGADDAGGEGGEGCLPGSAERWVQRLPPEGRQCLRRALMKRLVSCLDKLEQVQRDKPGNWKLWRGKLVSEHYWGSLCDAEKLVSEEIDACISEAEELQPGWKDHIFMEAVQCWRMQKAHEAAKKNAKKSVVQEKKEKEKEVKRAEVEERKKIEDKERQEKAAEKAMEKLLREEELAARSKSSTKARGGDKAAAPKSKSKKK